MDGTQQQRAFVAPDFVDYQPEHAAVVSGRRVAQNQLLLLVVASFLTLFAPFLFADIPPLVDLPNHLARFWLLAGGVKDPALSHYWLIDWSNASTNIGVDLIASLLSPPSTAFLLARLAAFAAAALPPLGVLALNYSVFRRWSPWQAIFPVAAWATTFLMGFLNFQIGIGLALFFAAADPWLSKRLRRFTGLARMPIAALLAIDHPFGLLFYAALVAGLTFGADPINWRRSAGERERLFRAGVAASWCLVPLLTLLIFAPALPGADTQAVALSYGRLAYRLAALLTPLSSYSIVIAAIFTLTLSGSIFWLARRGLLLMHGGLLLATVGLVVAALLVPDQAGGGSWISRRMPTMVLLALLAALQIDPRVKVRLGRGIAIAAFAMVAAQAAWISWCWHGLDANITTVKRVLASVPAGSTVLPMQHDPNLQIRANASGGRYVTGVGDPTFRHDASLATPLRRAFVPTLFSARGLQPLQVHGPWARFVEHNGGELASVSALGRPGLPTDPVYLKGWRARFDYILVLNADLPDAGGEFIPPKGLHLVSNAGFAQLWRIDHPEQ